jgi:hypothetical protein
MSNLNFQRTDPFAGCPILASDYSNFNAFWTAIVQGFKFYGITTDAIEAIIVDTLPSNDTGRVQDDLTTCDTIAAHHRGAVFMRFKQFLHPSLQDILDDVDQEEPLKAWKKARGCLHYRKLQGQR